MSLRRRSLSVPAVPAVLAVLALTVAGCSSSVTGSAAPVPGAVADRSADPSTSGGPTSGADPAPNTDIGPVPDGLQDYYTQQLEWGGCTDYADNDSDRQSYATEGLECARMRVPVSYSATGAGDATIGVLRAAATGDAAQRIGSVVFNPGGPGGSGMAMVSQFAAAGVGTALRARFDLVGFDPRGTGASEPVVSCRTDEERDAQRAANLRTDTEAGVREIDAAAETFADDCTKRTGRDQDIDGATFLANVGTRDVAKDMDVLRAVLGDRQLTYVGFSYGTRIGTEYAEQFAGNVRAMILDGAVDPELDPIDQLVNQGAGFQQAFEAFAADCATQPTCPLGTDPAKATAVFQQIVRPLLDKPLDLSDGRVLTYDDATTGTIQALYSESFWPPLQTALTQLLTGKGDALMTIADLYEGRDASGHYSPLLDAFTAINCVDNPRVSPDVSQKISEAYVKAAPFIDPGDPVRVTKDICDYWPAAPTSEPHTPQVDGLPTVMVISTTGDPATPYQAGVDLAKDLKASLLTVTGDRHTAYLGAQIPCADDAGNAYLISLTAPETGAKC